MKSIARLLSIVVLLGVCQNSFGEVWQEHYNKSIEGARQQQKYVFVYFHSNGCQPCLMMNGVFRSTHKNTVYGRSPKELMDSFIVVPYNISDPAQRQRFLLYKQTLDGRPDFETMNGTPAFLLINPNDLRKDGLNHSTIIKNHVGYLDANEFVEWVYKAVNEDYLQ